jgi:iron(III) transport system substrate-binding protein
VRLRAAESLKAYSIQPENYARPMLETFEKASGIHDNFIRFSSGEALARLLAEKGNPQVDVLFGGPVETFTAGEEQGIFEAYTPPSAADLPQRFKRGKGMWTAIADDPLGCDWHRTPARSRRSGEKQTFENCFAGLGTIGLGASMPVP